MGGLVIETVRPGVQFVPDAAAAFRRADAQVRAEFGRGIDVNSTYRSWDDQMLMFVNWGRYVAGKGPHPGHSKAVHPSESFHVAGVALDSDDWRIPRIVEILAENGFIRNRLHVPNENHHFEWLRNRDQNYGKPIGGAAASTVPQEGSMSQESVQTPNGKIYAMATGSILHLKTVSSAGITTNVNSTKDEIHKVTSTAEWIDLLDGMFIPRYVLDADGNVLNPETGRFEVGGAWSWERANTAANAAIRAEQAEQAKRDAALKGQLDRVEKAFGELSKKLNR